MTGNEKIGVLLINTGTTDAPRAEETRVYLRQFLSDPRVLDINPVVRWLLLNLVILRTRPKNSAHAYSQIWTGRGSPLIANSLDLAAALKERMPRIEFAIGMRYGKPSIESGFDELLAKGVDRLIAAPLFPQYSSAANGSALEVVYSRAAKLWNVPPISVLPPCYADPGFINAWAAVCAPVLDAFKPDLLLLSYHGLPERHVKKSDKTGGHCLASASCCNAIVDANQHCYRAHCMATSRLLAAQLGLADGQYSVAFQSRLGRDPWIKPATDEVVPALAKKGIKRLAVACPSFTADCLETLEEIGMRAKDDFFAAGGEAFAFIPCLNAHPVWVDALAGMLENL
ncbi:MAG: ferrochelatase [Candidatus Hydrogenedentes bacterium]|nr:ferrochelatase [Candidatus Hydrogenedentota bacterium]